MMKAVAIDDEPLALDIICGYAQSFDFLQIEKTFSKTSLALQYLEKNPIDLLFLDIHMPAMSGMDLYRMLPQKPLLIFTTSYSQYAVDSYELNAIDYLLKPFSHSRFEKAICKAFELYKAANSAMTSPAAKTLVVKSDYGLLQLQMQDIILIEGLDNYLKIHLQNQPAVITRMTMMSMMERLAPHGFVRVHRSYIVAVKKITSVKQRILQIGGQQVPVGKNFEAALQQALDFIK